MSKTNEGIALMAQTQHTHGGQAACSDCMAMHQTALDQAHQKGMAEYRRYVEEVPTVKVLLTAYERAKAQNAQDLITIAGPG